jgi:hypothetical protein
MSFKKYFLEKTSACDITNCGGTHTTKAFSDYGFDAFKKLIRSKPRNKKHCGTFRKGFEFIVKDFLWEQVMREENLYICLECFEREYLTLYLKDKKIRKYLQELSKEKSELASYAKNLLNRKPNEFGFYEVKFEDLAAGNPVNEGFVEFAKMVKKVEDEAKKSKDDEFSGMISKQDREAFGSDFDDEDMSFDFSDYS